MPLLSHQKKTNFHARISGYRNLIHGLYILTIMITYCNLYSMGKTISGVYEYNWMVQVCVRKPLTRNLLEYVGTGWGDSKFI